MSSTATQAGSSTGSGSSSRSGLTTGSGPAEAEQHSEGVVARTIEQQTAKLPSDIFLWAAFGSIGVSAVLQLSGKQKASLFVGQWVAPFLLLGVYNKIVKVSGSDRVTP